jgi:hypothetical protein
MDSLNELITRLQHLHLEQARIIRALEDIVEIEIEPFVAATSDTIVVPTVLETNERGTATTTPTPRTPTAEAVGVSSPTVFYIGQRVYITNRITHVPLLRRATEADRTAIVTHFTATRVAIRTITGIHTHRHPKNLRPL